jgi:hypothetical protein
MGLDGGEPSREPSEQDARNRHPARTIALIALFVIFTVDHHIVIVVTVFGGIFAVVQSGKDGRERIVHVVTLVGSQQFGR